MKLYSYVVARDYGFAPNPFYGVCTLATCKPLIRKSAGVGDWIVGTGSKVLGRGGYVVYAMKVDEVMTLDQYWADKRFEQKKPNFRGSRKAAFGDNIYHRPNGRKWAQCNSHHSYEDGRPNPHNVKNDTKTNRMLVGYTFSYWGGSGPKLPTVLQVISAGRGHKCNFPESVVNAFVTWMSAKAERGYLGAPTEWR